MEAINSIVVGVDDSPASEVAAARALELARPLGATVRLVHVLPPLVYLPETMGADFETGRFDAASQTMAQLRTKLGGATQGVTVVDEVASGSPAETLNAIAARNRAQLIVVGSHGQGPISRLLLGSVADRLAHVATTTVMVVR